MAQPVIDRFPPGIADKLKTYVYRLIDPRTGATFYVGKGKGDRVFAHARAEVDKGERNAKLQHIGKIRMEGFEVAHVIHRHGMDDKTALEVEAALIDAYPGLKNQAGGYGNSERGAMHVQTISRQYAPQEANFTHKCLLIYLNQADFTEPTLYETVRTAWKLSPVKAQQAQVVLATRFGLIVGAFIAEQWLPATPENFPGLIDSAPPGRYGFIGKDAPKDIWDQYVFKRVPDKFRKRGAANPIRYTW